MLKTEIVWEKLKIWQLKLKLKRKNWKNTDRQTRLHVPTYHYMTDAFLLCLSGRIVQQDDQWRRDMEAAIHFKQLRIQNILEDRDKMIQEVCMFDIPEQVPTYWLKAVKSGHSVSYCKLDINDSLILGIYWAFPFMMSIKIRQFGSLLPY